MKRTIPPLTLCCLVRLKDERFTTLDTPWTTPLVTVVRHLHADAWNYLRMPIVPNSEAEILNILKLPSTRKVMDGGQLTGNFANGRQAVIQGQGHLTKCGIPWGIPPVV